MTVVMFPKYPMWEAVSDEFDGALVDVFEFFEAAFGSAVIVQGMVEAGNVFDVGCYNADVMGN